MVDDSRRVGDVAYGALWHDGYQVTLTLEKVIAPNLCEGSEWIVVDQNVLAEQVARIAVGQYRHVSKILLGVGASITKVNQAAKKDAVSLLSLKPDEKPWHRDVGYFKLFPGLQPTMTGASLYERRT